MLNGWRDVRFGLRMLNRNKGFAAVAILALALGIGPNVAIFSIIWATFLAPLPYPNANQLVVVWSHFKGERNGTPADDYARWAAQSQSFQHLDMQSWNPLHLTNADHTQDETRGLRMTPGFLTKDIGDRIAMGRDFSPDEGTPGKDHEVILTHRLWETRYHADAGILGKNILIDDAPYTVVGVLEAGPADRIPGTQFMIPFRPQPGVHSEEYGNVFGRLKPGVTLAQAQAEMTLVDKRLAPTRNEGGGDAKSWSVSVEQLKNDWLDRKLQRNLWLLLAAVGLVLLIACANVANLLLARGAARQQELALRSAMGATRGEVFAQLLTESLTLATIGGAIGIAMGWSIMKLAMAILPLEKQTAEAVVGLNGPVLAFAVGATLVAGIVFGCAPAWQAADLNLAETLKQGGRSISGRGRSGTQGVLVTAEFALALTLLAGAGMALHSFWNLSRIDLGIRTDNVVTGFLTPQSATRQKQATAVPPPEQILATQRQLLEKLRAVPAVQDAALSTGMPLSGSGSFPFAIEGQPADPKHPPTADFEAATPSFFETFGVHLVRGRFLSESDTASGPPAIVVNESFVRRYLANASPLNTRLMVSVPLPGQTQPGPARAFQIVGVYHDIMNNDHLTGGAQPQMYLSLEQFPWPYVGVAVRTSVDPASVMPGVRSAVAAGAPGFTLEFVTTIREILSDQTTGDRFGMVLFGGFAGVALVLAALGIYGVMSFTVAQRTHEIGLRMALGAQKSEVVALIVRSGIRLALPGMAIGLAGVFVLGRLMHSTLYGVGAMDYASTALVAVVLFAVALLACWIPARRSAQVDPMVALRDE
jgi:putative ABC transport system permease protein